MKAKLPTPPDNRPGYLVITEKFLPRKGGSNTWYHEVYSRLGDRGTHIVTAHQPDCETFDANHRNSVHRLSLKRIPWLRPESLLMYWRLLSTAITVGRSQQFDAVHCGRALPEGLVGWLVARLLRLPLTIYCHGEELTTWTQPMKFRFMLFSYRRADIIIANSHWTRDELIRIGVPARPIRLIFPGVDTQRYRPGLATDDLRASIGLGSNQPLLLSVGRLTRRKGFDQLLKSMPALLAAGHDLHYALIGIGDDRNYLQKLSEQLGVSERVHFLGHVPEDDLPRWYNLATLFAMPNREIDGDTEGFGLVFLEAAACGCPAIAGDAGGTGDALEDGVTGLRVNGADQATVYAAIANILDHPALATRMAQAGRQRARSEFDWQRVADKTLALSHPGLPDPTAQAATDAAH